MIDNTLEEFVQRRKKKWTPRYILYRILKRLRRSMKRRMKGESYRQWLDRNLHDSEAGIWFDLVQCFISLLMVRSVVEQNWTKSNYIRDDSYQAIDFMNLVAIALNFCLRFYAASNRTSFCFHWLSIVDLFCVLPLFIERISLHPEQMQNKYVFRFLLMVRTIRILQLYRLIRLAKSAKARQGFLIGLTAICIIICAAATFQTIEFCDPLNPKAEAGKTCQDLTFFDALYFVCITIGTVGYGEYAPKTKFGKAVDIVLIIFTGTLIPILISGYTDILSRETAFDKRYVPDKNIQHILLCGDIENGALRAFLYNWLYIDGERGKRRKVIILSPTLPSSTLRRILIHRDYEQHVLYLQGSAMDTSDLKRAGAPTAAYCFIMVKKHSEFLDQNDTATNLLTCAVRKNNRHAPVYVQVSKFDNVRHINISGASAVACVEQLKLTLLSKSLWMRGLNAFVGNLTQRFGITEALHGFWMSDYMAGCGQRIFEATTPSFMTDLPSFRALGVLIYREFGVPVVGLRTVEGLVTVLPLDKDIADVPFTSIFFIGKGVETAIKIEKLTIQVMARHTDIAPTFAIGVRNNRSVANLITSMGVPRLDFNPFRNMAVAVTDEPAVSNQSSGGPSIERPIRRASDRTAPLYQKPHLVEVGLQHGTNRKMIESPRAKEHERIAQIMLDATEAISQPLTETDNRMSATTDQRSTMHDPDTRPGRTTRLRSIAGDRSQLGKEYLSNRPPVLHRSSMSKGNGSAQSPNLLAARARQSTVFRSFRRNRPPADLSNHFVVCGLPTDYAEFLAGLSGANAQDEIPGVVFITPHELTERDFHAYVVHPRVYFVRGSPVSTHVFQEARMLYARAILILSYCGSDFAEEYQAESESMDEHMADVDAITTHRFISETCQQHASTRQTKITMPYIVVEMMRPSNVKFLIDRSGSNYNERTVEHEFWTGELLHDVKCLDKSLFSPLYAAGHIYFSNVWDALLGSCGQHPHLIEMIAQLLVGNKANSGQSDDEWSCKSRLHQIPVPAKYHHHSYGMTVEEMLLHEGVMVLGIYRSGHTHISPPFVITNPIQSTVLSPHDLFFVIG